jgi:hypothetical protein
MPVLGNVQRCGGQVIDSHFMLACDDVVLLCCSIFNAFNESTNFVKIDTSSFAFKQG